jgi:hypothetical protein
MGTLQRSQYASRSALRSPSRHQSVRAAPGLQHAPPPAPAAGGASRKEGDSRPVLGYFYLRRSYTLQIHGDPYRTR